MRAFLARVVLAGLALSGAEARATLTLTKTPSPASISAGDVASFVYSVHNTTTTALSVTLVDTLPAGVTWSENSTFCTMGSGRDLVCNFGTLAAGTTRGVTVTGTTDFNDCGTLSSTATAGGSTGGDQATAGVVVRCPDVNYNIGPDSGAYGAPFAVTMSVRNAGAGIARSVQFSHTYVKSGLTWALEPPDPLCAIGPDSVTCAVGDLAPGAGHSSRIVSNITTNLSCGAIDPTLNVSLANEPEPCCPGRYLPVTLPLPGDPSGNCVADVNDVFYLINYLFAGGPPPVVPQ
jgi:uncharacterized repeat protein (TIGR01451 family)